MTPKEKAIELVGLFSDYTHHPTEDREYTQFRAKECSIICVYQVLESIPRTIYCDDMQDRKFINPDISWWNEVKQEIEKL